MSPVGCAAEPVWSRDFTMLATEVLSLNDRRPRMRVAARARELRTLGYFEARRSGDPAPRLERALIVVTVLFSTRGRRDPHNFAPTVKPIVDGLVQSGLLPDDDSRHLDLRIEGRAGELSERIAGRAATTFRFDVYDLAGGLGDE